MSHSFINKESYDQVAANYAEDHGKELAWQPELDIFISLIDVPKVILDLGCGHGDETIYLASNLEGTQVTGVDFSNKMIELAMSKKSRASFETADITTFKPASTISGIWARASLHHLSEPELRQLLLNADTYLAPHSIFAMINKYGSTEEIEEKQKYGQLLKRYFNYFNEDKIEKICQSHGYTLLQQYHKEEGGHTFLVSFLQKI